MILPGPDRTAVVQTWARRFLCVACKATCSVSPPEVLPRHTYTLSAIVLAWFHAVDEPLGDGLDDPCCRSRRAA